MTLDRFKQGGGVGPPRENDEKMSFGWNEASKIVFFCFVFAILKRFTMAGEIRPPRENDSFFLFFLSN